MNRELFLLWWISSDIYRLLSFTVECSLLSVLKFPQHMETAELGFFLVSFKFIQSAFSVISPVSLVFWSFSYPSSSESLGNTLVKMWSSNCFKLNYIWICISQFKVVTELKEISHMKQNSFKTFDNTWKYSYIYIFLLNIPINWK